MIKKISHRLQEYGVKITLFRIVNVCMAFLFELYYGLDTEAQLSLRDIQVTSANKLFGEDYQAAPYLPIRLLFKKIMHIIPEKRSFVDYGCGKGRAMLIAAEHGIRIVKGIEFSPLMGQISKAIIKKYNKRAHNGTKFSVIEADVLDYKITAEDNIFFLFNPFNDVILDQVLDRIEKSLAIYPRFLIIIYVHPEHEHLIERRSFCKTTKRYNFWSYKMNVYLSEQREIS